MVNEAPKGKPLTKTEIKILLDLIDKSEVIILKSTSATNNLLKNKEWERVTRIFNSNPSVQCHRTVHQLRLKWENLKKSCRKRNSRIELANIASTKGTLAEYIHPDELLDQVADILQRNAKMYEQSEVYVDSHPDGSSDALSEEFGHEDQNPMRVDEILIPNNDKKDTSVEVPIDECVEVPCGPSEMKSTTKTTKMFPRKGKKRAMINDRGRTARNLAIAEYYKTKRKCLDAKLNNIMLENKKVELENKKLMLEILDIMKK